MAAAHRAVAVDFGTGDGCFVQRAARQRPDVLVIGVDANADQLRPAAARVARKPARGGLPNALFGQLTLEQAPGALAGLADELTVIFPWGSLLRAVACAEPPALAQLRALCKSDAEVRVLFGYGPADRAAVAALGLPAAGVLSSHSELTLRYRQAGLLMAAREVPLDEVRAVPTTWAKKLAFSGHGRTFWELRCRARW